MKMYQQGDVLMELVSDVPNGAKTVVDGQRGYVLARGETTGHAHRIEDIAGVEFLEKDGVFYIINKKPATVLHEEHQSITLPPGTYRVRGVREYDHFAEEARRIQD